MFEITFACCFLEIIKCEITVTAQERSKRKRAFSNCYFLLDYFNSKFAAFLKHEIVF